ncbi:protein RER1A-like [Arachis duranensis]|uniref:Protein RER1 n=1 Tax=Arachis duranensis TaxID=130453 RepID=A0A6P4BQB9_ARADU|nr:protein RER1A-like [Arachis duranensis]
MEEDGEEDASSSLPSPSRRVAGRRISKFRKESRKKLQYYLDQWAPHAGQRWIATLFAAGIYVLRVYYVRGFYIISYGLSTYILNLLIGFLSPQLDPQIDVLEPNDDPHHHHHHHHHHDEFKPFVRRLPEFKFWFSITKAVCYAFLMTFISVLDVPVFWPILLCYWIVLFILTMKRQIMHMIKYKYVPFNLHKKVTLPLPLSLICFITMSRVIY